MKWEEQQQECKSEAAVFLWVFFWTYHQFLTAMRCENLLLQTDWTGSHGGHSSHATP